MTMKRRGDRLLATAALVLGFAAFARADESGVSFWQPGTYDSLSATPNQPGWALSTTSFHGSAFAGASVSAARLVRIGALNETQAADLAGVSDNFTNIMLINPSYAFSEQMLGAQVVFGVTTTVGKASVYDHGTLSAGAGAKAGEAQLALGDSASGFGDLQPQLTFYWSDGDHHFMTYGTSNLPVGNYRSIRLANLGIGHGALDAGGGYTYLNQKAGVEFSAVAGFTYNFLNPYTNYKSGVDFHLDAGASKYLTDALFVGPVAYFYREVGCDSGGGDVFGCFRSQVAGAGAEMGYTTSVEKVQVYCNLKGYREFAAENR
ncbi:MAG TPA: transporter, partial [Methylocystis sp.]|nr:transporter [Methylocystis sp.]